MTNFTDLEKKLALRELAGSGKKTPTTDLTSPLDNLPREIALNIAARLNAQSPDTNAPGSNLKN